MLERTGAKRKENDKQEKNVKKKHRTFCIYMYKKGNIVFFLPFSLSGYFPVKRFLIYLNKKCTKIYVTIFQHSNE